MTLPSATKFELRCYDIDKVGTYEEIDAQYGSLEAIEVNSLS